MKLSIFLVASAFAKYDNVAARLREIKRKREINDEIFMRAGYPIWVRGFFLEHCMKMA